MSGGRIPPTPRSSDTARQGGARFLVSLLAASVASSLLADDGMDVRRRAMAERAERIVAPLGLDSMRHERVVEALADHYVALGKTHAAIAERSADSDEQHLEILTATDPTILRLHRELLGRLGAEVDPAAVDAIKNGMTYGVVPITSAAYQRLLPELTDEQRRFIDAALIEAREYAMDAGSAEAKHRWFGKYKGRINNYLSQQGYDLKEAELRQAQRAGKAKSN